MPAINNKIMDLSEYFIGTVMEIDIPTRRVAVYVPKLMPGIAGGSANMMESPTTTNGAIENISYNATVKLRNSIWVRTWDFNQPMPKPGSKVNVYFLDDNPKLGYWRKFNPNNDYEVIDEERFKKLFNLSVNGKQIELKEEDILELQLNEVKDNVYTENGKNKRFKIDLRDNYKISEEEPVNPYDGLLWYQESTDNLSIYQNGSFNVISLTFDTLKFTDPVDLDPSNFEDWVITENIKFKHFQDESTDEAYISLINDGSGNVSEVFNVNTNESTHMKIAGSAHISDWKIYFKKLDISSGVPVEIEDIIISDADITNIGDTFEIEVDLKEAGYRGLSNIDLVIYIEGEFDEGLVLTELEFYTPEEGGGS